MLSEHQEAVWVKAQFSEIMELWAQARQDQLRELLESTARSGTPSNKIPTRIRKNWRKNVSEEISDESGDRVKDFRNLGLVPHCVFPNIRLLFREAQVF